MKKEQKNQRKNSSKRKKSKRKEILEYLEDWIHQEEEDNIPEKTYNERLAVLQEFLGYLEDKNIINPQILGNEGEVQKLVKGLMKIDLTKICATQPQDFGAENYSRNTNNPEKIIVNKNKVSHFSKREKYSMISPLNNKENVNNNNTVQPDEWSNVGHQTRRLSQHSKINEEPSKFTHRNSVNNRNYSTGSILQLKEIDGNQIINQKVINKNKKRGSTKLNWYRPSSVIYQNNYISTDEGAKNIVDIPKPVISVSNKMNNTKMMPAPVFAMKEEEKYETAMFWSSDSSSTVTIGKRNM